MASKIQDLNEMIRNLNGQRVASNDQDTEARIAFPTAKSAREFASSARQLGAGAERQSLNPTAVVVSIR